VIPLLIIGVPVLYFALAPKAQQTGFVPGYQNGSAGNRTMTGSQPVGTSPIYAPQTPVIRLPNPNVPGLTAMVPAKVSVPAFKAAVQANPQMKQALLRLTNIPAWARLRLGIR
jgi:hypothetical protein